MTPTCRGTRTDRPCSPLGSGLILDFRANYGMLSMNCGLPQGSGLCFFGYLAFQVKSWRQKRPEVAMLHLPTLPEAISQKSLLWAQEEGRPTVGFFLGHAKTSQSQLLNVVGLSGICVDCPASGLSRKMPHGVAVWCGLKPWQPEQYTIQSFQKFLIEIYTLNHIGTLIMI